jgi:hypothetical protein
LFILPNNLIKVTSTEPREIILSLEISDNIPSFLTEFSPGLAIDSSESTVDLPNLNLRIQIVLTPRSDGDFYSVSPPKSKPPSFTFTIHGDTMLEA